MKANALSRAATPRIIAEALARHARRRNAGQGGPPDRAGNNYLAEERATHRKRSKIRKAKAGAPRGNTNALRHGAFSARTDTPCSVMRDHIERCNGPALWSTPMVEARIDPDAHLALLRAVAGQGMKAPPASRVEKLQHRLLVSGIAHRAHVILAGRITARPSANASASGSGEPVKSSSAPHTTSTGRARALQFGGA